jgi:hypothetical protein
VISGEAVLARAEIVTQAARFVAKDYPDIETEDIAQELYIILIQKPELLDRDDDTLSPFLYGAARIVAKKIRGVHLYLSPQYSYRTSDVRRILETTFDYSEWQGGFSPGDDYSEYDDNDIVMRIDVKWAFELMREDQQQAVLSRYRDGVVPSSATPERRTLDRAVSRLTEILNTYSRGEDYEGPGNRKVMSNARSQHQISSQWEG